MKPKPTVLQILKAVADHHRQMARFYCDLTDDPHNISTALYVMHLDTAAAIEKALGLPVKRVKKK